MANSNLANAKRAKNDEFYTQLTDIEKELAHYKQHFAGKVVFCNCDDPFESNFFKYFALNFNHLKLKKLIATSYASSQIVGKEINLFTGQAEEEAVERKAYKIVITELSDVTGDGREDINDVKEIIRHRVRYLEGDGDFRSPECIELLKQADIVVTNPPFSLFREYVAQLIEYEKKFLLIGNVNAITYKEIFPLIKANKMWIGYKFNGTPMMFGIPDNYEWKGSVQAIGKDGQRLVGVGGTCWFTNLDHDKRHEPMILYKRYNEAEYPKYDNYDAINVDKTKDIPCDYYGVMGVPITWLDKYCPEQFEIVSFRKGEDGKDLVFTRERESSTVLSHPYSTQIDGLMNNPKDTKVNGKSKYARVLIRRKDLQCNNQS